MNRAPSGAPSTTEQAPFSASPQSLLGRRYERAARGEPAAGDGTACAPRPGPANTVGGRPPSWLWLSAGVVVFSAALLSFQVQPLVARYLLPRFGGGSSVWTVCLLFFQTTLMLGYAYAHWMSRRLTLRWQLRLHAALLLASLALLPVLPRAGFEPDPARDPTASLLLFLVRHLGLPFLVRGTDLAASIPRRLADAHQLAVRALPFSIAPLEVYALWHRRTDADKANRWLRELLVAVHDQGPHISR